MADEQSEDIGEAKEGYQPKQASAFRKVPILFVQCALKILRSQGHNIILKGKPCKVVEMTTSKTGKHGHAKINFTGLDIFTGKKVNR